MKPIVHGIAGSVAMLTVATFWMSTVISEAFLDHAAVALVKQCVVYALVLLITAMAVPARPALPSPGTGGVASWTARRSACP